MKELFKIEQAIDRICSKDVYRDFAVSCDDEISNNNRIRLIIVRLPRKPLHGIMEASVDITDGTLYLGNGSFFDKSGELSSLDFMGDLEREFKSALKI